MKANGEIWPGWVSARAPYSFSKDILGFLMTTESQDLIRRKVLFLIE